MDEADEYLIRTPSSIEDYRDELARQDEADLATQLDALKAGRAKAFFYPNPGFDWERLFRLSHLCSLFVYVDPRVTEDRFNRAFEAIRKQRTKAGAGLESLQVGDPPYTETLEREALPVALQENLDWVWDGTAPVTPWVTAKLLGRNIGQRRRRLWLLYIGGSPLAAYRRLFAEREVAPRCLCLRQLVDVDTPGEAMATYHQRSAAWRNAARWRGSLGQMVQTAGVPLPELLVGEYHQFGWPHDVARQYMENWQANNPPDHYPKAIYGLPGASWPDLEPAQDRGERHVIVTRRPVNPRSARQVDAVVISPATYRRYEWPRHLTVILKQQPEGPAQPLPGQRVLVREIEDRPLAEGLQLIEQAAVKRNLRRVAVESLGFEDEGEFLPEWRRGRKAKRGRTRTTRKSVIRELIFHVASDGGFLDFAPYADEFD
jgi:hypothetical protein